MIMRSYGPPRTICLPKITFERMFQVALDTPEA